MRGLSESCAMIGDTPKGGSIIEHLSEIFEDSDPWTQTCIGMLLWLCSHINVATGILAFFIAAFSFKASYYRSKSARIQTRLLEIQYTKTCAEFEEGQNK
jgi:hypothetical protein